MDWQERMNRALAYIEANLTGDIAWEHAACEAACSPFHFLRMFEVITGVTAAEYVRRRRLTLAAMDLAASDGSEPKIIEIALRYGYDSADAFAKAFRKLFGHTPSEARQPGIRLRSYPPIAFSVALIGAHPIEYRIERKPAFTLTGLPLRTSRQDDQDMRQIPAFWDRLVRDGTQERLLAAASPRGTFGMVGVITDFDLDVGAFTYLAAIEAPTDRSSLPPGCQDVVVPAARYGIFEVHGPCPGAIQHVIQRVFTEWLPAANWERALGPQLEVYLPGDSRSADYHCEVWVPIQRPSMR